MVNFINPAPTLTLHVNQPHQKIWGIDGMRSYIIQTGPQIVEICCNVISNEIMSVEEFKHEIEKLEEEKIEVLASLIKGFTPEFFSMEIPHAGGHFKTIEFFDIILPRLYENRERQAYEKEVSQYINEGK